MKKISKLIVAILISLLMFSSVAWANDLEILTANAPYRIYQNAPEIKVLEQLLVDKGFFTKTPDEYFDFTTYLAVKAVQKQMGVYPNGVADSRVISYLINQNNAAVPAPSIVQNTVPSPAVTQANNGFLAPAGSKLDVSRVLYPLTQDEQKLLELINQERVKVGIAPLKFDYRLTLTARLKSLDLIKNNYFGHISPVYGAPWAMMGAVGVKYLAAGENIAGTWATERAHNNFMNSAGHRANILNPKYTHYGVGIIKGGPYGMMFTEHFAQE